MQIVHDILIVDDEESNIKLMQNILGVFGYKLRCASNGKEALEEIQINPPDIVLLDIMMPEMNGFEVCRKIKSDPYLGFIPVVLVTGLDQFEHRIRGVEAGADDFITKPVHPAEITARVKNLLKIKEMHNELLLFQKKLREQNLILEDMVKERTKALELALKELLESHEKLVNTQKNTLIKLSLAAEYKDRATANHIQRIGYYSKTIASALGWSEEMQEIINLASQMHDVGKIGIPDSILTKSRKLTPHELAKMREHTFIGSKLLSGTDSQLLKMAEEIAMSHHEQWDGKGYPRGLKGKEIPLSGRISAVADVFDALISARCYKKAWEIEKVFRTIKKCAGTRFDPEVVDAFFRVKDKLIEIVRKCREN